MKYFFDTSSLLKRYIDESGSLATRHLLRDTNRVFVSSVTIIECLASMRRMQNEGLMNAAQYEMIKDSVLLDFTFFTPIPLTGHLIKKAIETLATVQLKSLDTIQLTSALTVANHIDAFVASDKKLIQAAKALGLTVIIPEE